jgi:alpha-beta hydrolase superfamily lysophospholipase
MKQSEFSWQGQAGQPIFAQKWAPDGVVRGAVSLVHGLGEHTGRYQHVAARFTQAGYAVVGFDLPGHGRTPGPRGHASFDEICKEIDCLLSATAQQYPGMPHYLYGHSMGGVLSLYYILRRRPALTGAIVTSPGLATGMPVPGWKITLARVMSRLSPSFSLSNGLDRDNLSRDPAVIAAYASDPLVHDKISARLGLDMLTLGDGIIAQAKDFPIPLLLMQGAQDHIVSLPATRAFASGVPAEKITFKVWDGLCHETHNEPEQDQVIQTMLTWLDQHA